MITRINFKKIKNCFSSLSSQAGFTLIELLIVIAILGILSTAVLSAINPIEQLNRGRDTGTQSDAEQLIGAITRFNASNGFYPWQTGANDSANIWTGTTAATDWTYVNWNNNPCSTQPVGNPPACGWTIDNVAYVAHTPATGWVAGNNVLDRLGSDTLITDSQKELQSAFINRITGADYNELYVYNEGTNPSNTTYVCFRPQSNQFRVTALARCTATPGTPSDYPAQACAGGTADTVYMCLP
ncbi:type II secretion system protein [Candidatus Microgenomates bacterium]|nr:MAG: type II secretion system protein [Candidatus Microgenomates bacterium]